MKMNQLKKYQKQFLDEAPDSNDSSPAEDDIQRYLPDTQKPYIEPITEESMENDTQEVSKESREDISFNCDKSDSPAWTNQNTIQTERPKIASNSDKNFHHLDSSEKQIKWTQSTNKQQHYQLPIFLSFIEKLQMRESLCVTNDSQQQLESMILTMCCKENADLYNDIIQDLQGFENLRRGSHVKALNAVQQQSERLVLILSRFCETKYETNQFYELMYSILQPNNVSSSLSGSEQQMTPLSSNEQQLMIPERSKHQSFSFEDMSIIKHMQSKGHTNKSKNDSSIQKNCFSNNESDNQVTLVERQTPQQESDSSSEEQPRSPLRANEIKFCKRKMIEQLRVECQDYELTIVDQQNEIGQLRDEIGQLQEIISRKANLNQMKTTQLSQIDKLEVESLIKRFSSDIKKLNLEKDQQCLQIAEDRILIQSFQEKMKELKQKNVDAEKRLDHNSQNQLAQHELETLRHEHVKLKQGFQEIQDTCRQKENQLISVEKQAQIMLKQAQSDAEECINYFKSIAVNNQASTKKISTGGFNSPTGVFPKSLAPSQLFKRNDHADQHNLIYTSVIGLSKAQVEIRSPQTLSSDKTRSVSMPRPAQRLMSPIGKDDYTFDSTLDLRTADNQLPFRVQICLEAMSKSFQEVFELKSGLLSYIAQYRDSYCDQVKNFSVYSYDYIDKIQNLILQESTLQTNLKKYEEQVEELRQVTNNQAKHIKAQSELLLLYRDQVRTVGETNLKQIKRKDKERADIIKFVTAELPLLAEGLTATTSQIGTIRTHQQEANSKLDEFKLLHEITKKKMRLLEDELDIALRQKKDNEKVHEETTVKYERITDLIQDVWIAEIQPMPQHKNFSFDKVSMNLKGAASNGTLLSSDGVAMPCNWLADLRDYIKQLKEINDYQKEECYQLLNIVNTSVANEQQQLDRTETDGLTFMENDSQDHQLSIDQQLMDHRCYSDLGSDENDENSSYEGKGISHRQRANEMPLRQNIKIFSPRQNESNQNKFQPIIQRHLQRSNFQNQVRSSRNNSDDQRQKSCLSQRTAKMVSFSGQLQTSSVCKSPTYGNEKVNRSELHQMLRNEIFRMTKDQKIGKETILQMKLDLKAQRCQIQDQKAEIDQLVLINEEITASNAQQEDELKDQENNTEQLNNVIKEREECIQMLRTQIEDFEKELESMQQQMGNIIAINQQVSQSSEHWERMHYQVTQEFHHEKNMLEQKIIMIQEQYQDKFQTLKGKIFEKEMLMQETAKLLEREREFRACVEAKKLAVSDEGSETQIWFGQIESQNESLRLQLNQVKDDVKAVLEQYDKELTKSKQHQKKSEKLRETNKQLIDELNQSRVDLNNLSHQMQGIGEDYDRLTAAFNEQQQHFQDQVCQANLSNEALQQQVDSVTQLAEELQEQIFNSTQNNEEVQKQIFVYETRIRELDQRNQEMRISQKEDISEIERQKSKIQELKGQHQRRQSSQGEPPQNHFSQTHGSKRLQIQEPGFMGQSQHNVNLSASSSPIRNANLRTKNTSYLQKDSCIVHENANLSDLMLDETDASCNVQKRCKKLNQVQMDKVERPYSALTGQPTHYSSNNIKTNRNCRGKPSVSPQNNPFHHEISNVEGFESNTNTMDLHVDAQSCYKCSGNNTGLTTMTTRPTPNSNQILAAQNDVNELKARAFAKDCSKKKETQILTYIEDIIKFYCKQQAERFNNLNRNCLNQSSSQHLKKHAQEWSSNNLLDCWGTEESDIIEARAFFGKKSPSILSNLKLLADLNLNNDQMTGKYSQDNNMQPVTITSSRINVFPDLNQPIQEETYQQSSRKELLQHQKSEFMEAFQNLAVHCQTIYMKLAQIGRSLAGICYGGCMIICEKYTKEHKKNVAYAMNYLAQDTTVQEATSGENLQEIQRVTDSLISCVSQIITVACQTIQKKGDQLSEIKKDPMKGTDEIISSKNIRDEKICFSEGIGRENDSHSNLNFVSTFGQNQHQRSGSQFVKEKLLDVENRIKQKFSHVSKLEASLEQLLSRSQVEQKNLKNQSVQQLKENESSNNSSSMFADTRTVLKLLSTVKRVVSKLKIELHQDYLSLGQINVGIVSTPTNSSHQSQRTLQANTPNAISLNLNDNTNGGTHRDTHRAKLARIIDEMQGLTFEPSLTNSSSGQQSLNV